VHAQWSDDFHHAVHVALTGETSGYYADFERRMRSPRC
jgi:maltooligosyltrehalose trehalohydrolase